MSKLVIVESPAKARTINRYLGEEYRVMSCRGHVRDLPKNDMGVDIEKGFKPTYQVKKESKGVVAKLKKAAQEADEVYLATDLDREGEAIAWHLAEAMKLPKKKVRRVTFNEITAPAIRRAFSRPEDIDQDKVNAQQARRVLDRIVGYELSPLLWRKVLRGLSAGRVQSVATMLVVDREREIESFQPTEHWELEAELRPQAGPSRDSAPSGSDFTAKLTELDGEKPRLPDEKTCRETVNRLQDARYAVAGVSRKTRRGNPSPPFITSRLQQAAWSRLRISTRQTMRIAQQLYEGVELGAEGSTALITYMRTDSVHVSPQAVSECRKFIESRFGGDYLPAKGRQFRQPRHAQAAHEAIRPTSVARKPEDVKQHLNKKQYGLYELIWKQFVASQMKPSRREVVDVTVRADEALFTAQGKRLLFDGHEKVSGLREEDNPLPALEEGQELDLVKLDPSQHFTQPPPRYTEGSLVRTLERLGIGRPSTYAPIISTIQERGYTRREKGSLHATTLGKVVTAELVEHFPKLLNVRFTSQMEGDLDDVERGEGNWKQLLEDFHKPFSQDLEKAKADMERVPGRKTDQKCEKCGAPLVIRSGRFGLFLGCSKYPECDFTKPFEDNEREPPEETEEKCPECGKPLVIRRGPRGRFYGCSGYPECTFTRPLKGTSPRRPPEKTDIICDKCGQPMVVRYGPRGRFLGCSAFPKCRNTKPLPAKEKTAKEKEHPRKS